MNGRRTGKIAAVVVGVGILACWIPIAKPSLQDGGFRIYAEIMGRFAGWSVLPAALGILGWLLVEWRQGPRWMRGLLGCSAIAGTALAHQPALCRQWGEIEGRRISLQVIERHLEEGRPGEVFHAIREHEREFSQSGNSASAAQEFLDALNRQTN